jgi:hypothetical protein
VTDVLENYRPKELRSFSTGSLLELDVFLPKEGLALEYQGEHHYRDVYGLGNRWESSQRDKEKREICKEMKITLIEIPYWWDKTSQSLAATIKQFREDLIPNDLSGELIPSTPPGGFPVGLQAYFSSNYYIS